MKKIPKNIREEAERIRKEFDKLENDPKIREECEEFHRKVSTLTPEDLKRRFTI